MHHFIIAFVVRFSNLPFCDIWINFNFPKMTVILKIDLSNTIIVYQVLRSLCSFILLFDSISIELCLLK